MSEGIQPKRFLTYLFIFAIALVFTVQFGPASQGCEKGRAVQAGNAAARVNGKEIPLREFNRLYYSRVEQLRQQSPQFTEEMARQFGLPKQVLDQMVELELLSQAAEQRGLVASDAEVRDEVMNNPSFHDKSGKFDHTRYRQVLNDFLRKTDSEFEAEIRRRRAASKLLEVVEGGALVSEDEVKAKYFREADKADLTYVRFLPALFTSKVTAPKPAELAAWQKEHAQQIAEHYEANKFQYHQQEQIKARQIFLRLEKDAPDAKKAEVRERLANLRKEIEGGKDFAQMAKDFSEDTTSRPQGGELGWIERGSLPATVADAAFALKAGELSQPIETPVGLYLIKLEEKKPPETKPLQAVEGTIAQQLYMKEKAKDLAKAEAEKALAALRSGKKLADLYPPEKDGKPAVLRYEQETRPEAVATGEFDRAAVSVPHLGPAPDLLKDVFALETPKALERTYPIGEGFAVAQVTARTRPSETELASKMDTLRNEARSAKKLELRDAFLKALRKSADVVTNEQLLTANVDQS